MLSQSLVIAALALFSTSTVAKPTAHYYKHGVAENGDVRSPCPALNTLANHGHLPRNGKNITAAQLSTAVQQIYSIDNNLANLLSYTAVPLVENNTFTATTLDLDHLNLHDAVEHDASLSRKNFIEGDNHSLQPDMVDAFIAEADGDFLTVNSLAKSRNRRERETVALVGKASSTKTNTLAFGEVALILHAFGQNDTNGNLRAPKKMVQSWFKEEKLPEGWIKPAKAISFTAFNALSTSVQNAAKALQGTSTSSASAGSGLASGLANLAKGVASGLGLGPPKGS
ncbi:Cloroperoxidase [Tothia fuscella]|uniref:Cloroperoxidase n=1 Tax=Tothia fuscella TaxID=1048955 RepID=A0A9P4U241_9PEZI|nr:Cloroperoxidase [Tothia fuscella]